MTLPMYDAEREKEIERLKAQVKRFEEKGYFDTAAHMVLRSYLNIPEAVSPQKAKKAKAEAPTEEMNNGE